LAAACEGRQEGGAILTERVVGFDLRADRTLLAPWDPERKARFLLRDDIGSALSVDLQVWPSMLSDRAANDTWHGVLDLWQDLEAMLAAGRTRNAEGSAIAITVVWTLLSEETRIKWATERLVATMPMTLGTNWTLLGYDVADEWLTSGLSNCGYSAAERSAWRSRWGSALNAHHLLANPDEAHRFALETDRRVAEHAPFFAYALYELATADS
jgi:hypothetical protein